MSQSAHDDPIEVPPPRRSSRGLAGGLAGFDLISEIGSGSTGTVHLATLRRPARGLAAGDRVAVKFLHQHLVDDPAARGRFLREARAGLNVRNPHLVRVYAIEEAEMLGSPLLYIVMELVEGPTLRDLLKEGVIAEPLVRSIGEQVARGIAALHASGAVHLDIKPENVVLAPGGRVVVMDLGFARSLTPSTESEWMETGSFAGSVAYAAPERLRGHLPGMAADIYSIGILLFELATGERPFPGDDPTVVLRGHLEMPAPAVSTKNQRVSPFLDAVVARCLEKNPILRFQSADELAQILNKAESSTFWQEKLAERSRAGAPGIRRVHLTPFQGRESELREIEASYARAAAGAFRVVELSGESGIGKTRIVDEFVTRAQESDDPPISLYGRCRKSEVSRPAEAFVAMLGRYLGIPPGAEPDANATRRFRALLPAAQANLLVDFMRGKRAEDAIIQFSRAVADFFEALAKEHPIIAFLDGADEGDAETIDITNAIIERAPAGACFIIGHRPASSRIDTSVELARSKKCLTSLAMGPLPSTDISAIIDNLIAPGEDRLALRDALVRVTSGNPGHLSEALRTLKASGALTQTEATVAGPILTIAKPIRSIPIPETLTEAIRARLNALDPMERQALSLVAAAGDRCDVDLLVGAFGGDEVTWLRALSRLETQHSLLMSAAGTFRFARPIVREVIYNSLDAAEKEKTHGAFAVALEKRLGPNASDRDRLRVAEHARRSANVNLALKYLPKLAENFRRRGLFERALVLARSSIELLNTLARRQKPLLEMRFDANATVAECASRMGNRALERRTLEKCARIATYLQDASRLARTLLSLGRLSYATGRYLVAASYLNRAIELASESGDTRTEAEGLLAKSIVVSYSGDPDKAGTYLERALSLAKESDVRARVLLQLGLRWLNLDRPDLAMPEIEQALAAFKELKMPAALAAAHFQRARCLADVGMLLQARKDLDRALTLARESGERRTETMTLSLRGAIRASQRDYESAEKDLRGALTISDEIGDKFTECHTALHLANTLLASRNPRRNLREAMRLARLALTLGEELSLPRLRALAHSVRARAHLRASRLADALSESKRAIAVLEEGPRDRRRAAAVLFTHGLILKESGRPEESRVYLNEAAAIVHESAARITDEKLKHAFLHDEPFHRKVIEAAIERRD